MLAVIWKGGFILCDSYKVIGALRERAAEEMNNLGNSVGLFLRSSVAR
jgi:hypothetical protein